MCQTNYFVFQQYSFNVYIKTYLIASTMTDETPVCGPVLSSKSQKVIHTYDPILFFKNVIFFQNEFACRLILYLRPISDYQKNQSVFKITLRLTNDLLKNSLTNLLALWRWYNDMQWHKHTSRIRWIIANVTIMLETNNNEFGKMANTEPNVQNRRF